jgi:F-box/WD-40 domain protein MET30
VGHVQQVLTLPTDYEPDDEIIGVSHDNADSVSVTSGRSSSPSGSCQKEGDDEVRALYGGLFETDPSRPLPPRYIMTGGLDSTIRLVSDVSSSLILQATQAFSCGS